MGNVPTAYYIPEDADPWSACDPARQPARVGEPPGPGKQLVFVARGMPFPALVRKADRQTLAVLDERLGGAVREVPFGPQHYVIELIDFTGHAGFEGQWNRVFAAARYWLMGAVEAYAGWRSVLAEKALARRTAMEEGRRQDRPAAAPSPGPASS